MPLEIPVHTVTARHPEVRKRAGASFSGRVGPRDPVLKVQQVKHKVPPACSHADDCACSLTAVGMTVCKKELASFRQQAGATTSLFLCFDEHFLWERTHANPLYRFCYRSKFAGAAGD